MKQHKRRQLSCLPCRLHKLKCDRRVPCQACVRYHRQQQCGQHPAPNARPSASRTAYNRLIQGPRSARHIYGTNEEVVYDNYPGAISLPPSGAEHFPARTVSPPLDSPATVGENQTFHQSNDQAAVIRTLEAGPGRASIQMPVFLSPLATSLLLKQGSQLFPNIGETQSFWRAKLVELLPTQNQCDVLVAFYFENINWIYSVVHQPSFRRQYNKFWDFSADRGDLVWLSLLFTMISLSALYLPAEVAHAIALDAENVQNLAHIWHSASRQALFSGGFESRPQVAQLTVFLASQLYFLSIKDGEALNSCLGQAVRNAQCLRMDRDCPGANVLETEIRRRLWWELWVCDTFQSLCYGRMPLIQTNPDRVPLPANCNDALLTETSMFPRPIAEPTNISSNVVRADFFKVFHRLFTNDGAFVDSWEYVHSLDQEVEALLDNIPWYHCQREWEKGRRVGQDLPSVIWQHNLVHTSIRIQRIRMLRPFLATHSEAYTICRQTAQEVLDSYKLIRNQPSLRQNAKFNLLSYQSYSSAIQLAAFILVERCPPEKLRQDIEMVIVDIEANPLNLPVVLDAQKVLRKMLQMHDRRDHSPVASAPESIAPEIAAILGGGEGSTRRYLRRCDIGYLLNNSMMDGNNGRHESSTNDMGDLLAFDMSLDMLSIDQWTCILDEMSFV